MDDSFYDEPDFKKKLFAIDDLVMNTRVDRDRPLPVQKPNSKLGQIKRYEFGIDCDEVFPGIIVGNACTARNKDYLKSISVTHVLNCAQGERFNMVSTDSAFYEEAGIKFKGLKLDDIWTEQISRTFDESTLFIDDALASQGKVLIHCLVGISRSATIAIAYLMLRHGKSVENAVKTVRNNRPVRPNEGFLRQLVQLDFKLRSTGQL